MKKKTILTGLAMFGVLAMTAGAASQVMAAGNNKINKERKQPTELTEAQKTEMKTKAEAVKTAEANGDYTAWVTAVKAMNPNSPQLKKITSAETFKTYLQERKDREAKIAAIDNALTAGDYNAWATATKAMNTNSPLLTKITADNFAKYAEAYKLRLQSENIMKDLGLNLGGPEGFGPHNGMKGGMGMDR